MNKDAIWTRQSLSNGGSVVTMDKVVEISVLTQRQIPEDSEGHREVHRCSTRRR